MSARPPVGRWPWPPLLKVSVGLHAAAAASALLWPGTQAWALGAVVLNHAGLTTAGLLPRSHLLGPNITRLPSPVGSVATPQPAFALTIDDGPDPATTPAVLDLLAELGVAATFFCIAERARAHPELLRRIVAAGHSVQNHTHRHRHHFSVSGSAALRREIGTAQQILADLTGLWPHCFRAPAGLRNPLLDPVLHALDLHLVAWTRRGYDTREPSAQRVLDRLTPGLRHGDILLLHDGNARRGPDGRPVILSVLPGLIAATRAAGLHPVTLDQALARRSSIAQPLASSG